jgi:hypothetical protein
MKKKMKCSSQKTIKLKTKISNLQQQTSIRTPNPPKAKVGKADWGRMSTKFA